MAGEVTMLIDDVERYITLRRSLGFKLAETAQRLSAFAHFAAAQGETHVRSATAISWATLAPSRNSRYRRLQEIAHFARFLRAEDPAHEVPPQRLFYHASTRPSPYIYTREELARLLDAAGDLRCQKPSPLRRHVYVMLFGLIAATGLRVSEALNLKTGDLLQGGVLP
jgi:integrase/recombinase XerD